MHGKYSIAFYEKYSVTNIWTINFEDKINFAELWVIMPKSQTPDIAMVLRFGINATIRF